LDRLDTVILSCGYSYHIEPFTTGGRRPLGTFLFRLQADGASRAYVHEDMADIRAGELLLYKPGDIYELSVEPGEDGKVSSGDYYMICHGSWIQSWWEGMPRPTHVRIGTDEQIISLWRHIIVEKRRSGEHQSELGGYLLRSLCLCLDQALKVAVGEPKQSFMAFRMKRFIEEHAASPFTVDQVAGQTGLSSSRAAHLFKETFGQSIMQYAQQVRLSMAVERMKYSTLTLDQIADSCGMGSYPFFHRVFKEKFGITPSVYRKRWLDELEYGGK
jgi:AraC family transcriptional regulator, arabinose operon regulatory protein